MAANDGTDLSPRTEREDADHLRRVVKDFIFSEHEKQHPQYETARKAIVGKIDSYCERITRPDFWGGKAELLHPNGFIPIQEYGTEFGDCWGGRKPVRLLLSGSNHYDLLV